MEYNSVGFQIESRFRRRIARIYRLVVGFDYRCVEKGVVAAQMRFRRGWLVGGHRAYDVKLAERLADSENLGRGEGDGE